MSTKILMVCLGNICRSPLAEGILASKLPNEHFIVDSAGKGNWHIGNPPDFRSIAAAKKKGISISNQKCRQIIISDFSTFDYIYVMDQSNYQDVIQLAENSEQQSKVKLLLNELYPAENKAVPDPYYGDEKDFDAVYDLIDKACNVIATNLIDNQITK
jgi:protein-tyrosine phosphatase